MLYEGYSRSTSLKIKGVQNVGARLETASAQSSPDDSGVLASQCAHPLHVHPSFERNVHCVAESDSLEMVDKFMGRGPMQCVVDSRTTS
jgi:hypothetical protein